VKGSWRRYVLVYGTRALLRKPRILHPLRARGRRLRARHCAGRPLPSERPGPARTAMRALVDGRGVRGRQDRHVRDVGVLRAGDCTV